ncbi:MAG: T9SS type A sorting domain-containing protein [Ignavibacteria bacterium]|nr:T9SS type A sorting domain-containing protein [Ignavibacteria bacterium]
MIIFGGEGDSLYNDTWQYSNVSVIGIEPVSNEIPGEFKLGQNYPNPFNPTTKMRIEIPNDKAQMSKVMLNVFDVTGKMVKELLNMNISAGIYEVEFDANGLPSGVYYYKLESGNYSETRKMVLVK